MMAEEDNGQVKKSGSHLIIKTKFKLSLKDIYNKTRRGTSWQQHDQTQSGFEAPFKTSAHQQGDLELNVKSEHIGTVTLQKKIWEC